jgi:hypothetical protein
MTDDDWFGDDVTSDGRLGLDVVKPAEEAVLRQESKGRQVRLEKLIQARKHEGKPLPENVQRGVALTALTA